MCEYFLDFVSDGGFGMEITLRVVDDVYEVFTKIFSMKTFEDK